MYVNDRQTGSSPALFAPTGPKQPVDGAFASILAAERVSGDAQSRNATVQESAESATAKKDVAFIKENGILAYIEENHKRKLEELREEILQNMGLTEETLSQMSPEQRGLIEKAISEEIQKRLAAEAAMNGGLNDDKQANSFLSGDTGTRNVSRAELLVLQGLVGAPGMVAGLSIGEAVSSPDEALGSVADARQGLPGKSGLLPD